MPDTFEFFLTNCYSVGLVFLYDTLQPVLRYFENYAEATQLSFMIDKEIKENPGVYGSESVIQV